MTTAIGDLEEANPFEVMWSQHLGNGNGEDVPWRFFFPIRVLQIPTKDVAIWKKKPQWRPMTEKIHGTKWCIFPASHVWPLDGFFWNGPIRLRGWWNRLGGVLFALRTSVSPGFRGCSGPGPSVCRRSVLAGGFLEGGWYYPPVIKHDNGKSPI